MIPSNAINLKRGSNNQNTYNPVNKTKDNKPNVLTANNTLISGNKVSTSREKKNKKFVKESKDKTKIIRKDVKKKENLEEEVMKEEKIGWFKKHKGTIGVISGMFVTILTAVLVLFGFFGRIDRVEDKLDKRITRVEGKIDKLIFHLLPKKK